MNETFLPRKKFYHPSIFIAIYTANVGVWID